LPKAPLRARLRKEVRAAILDAAESVFAQEGLHRGRMEHVSRRAGTAVGTLYNHFPSRDALLATLLRRRRQELLARVDAAVADAGPSFHARVAAFVDAIVSHYQAHRPFLAIVLQEDVAGAHAHVTAPGKERITRQLRVRADKIVRRGLREGVLRRDDADLWPDLLVGGVRALMLRDLGNGGRRSRALATPRFLEFFLHGSAAGRTGSRRAGPRRSASRLAGAGRRG
jgi:AcrR family transcriptional regulator